MKKRKNANGTISAIDVYQRTTLVVIAEEGELTDADARAFVADLMMPYKEDWYFDDIERVNYDRVLVHYRRRDPIAEMAKRYGGIHVHTTDPDGTETVYRKTR